MIKILIFTTFIANALYASEGHIDNEGVPSYVLWQAVNLIILFSILFYYSKEGIVKFFAKKRNEYLKQAQKSQAIFQDAEKQYLDIKHRLEVLNQTESESIEKAKRDALELMAQMIEEATLLAGRIKEEANSAAKLETQKAIQKLKTNIINKSFSQSKSVLSKDIGTQDHQKLQTDFANNIQAALL